MKANQLLQVIYSFFLGLVVVGFVGIGINTFYPPPRYTDYNPAAEAQSAGWALNTSIALLVCATAVMLISLIRSERQAVISNGLLLGGLFTMVYAVGMSIGASQSVTRFAVIAAALVVTVGVGWLKFVRGHRGAAAQAAAPSGELAERLDAVEARLDAVARALQG